MPKKNQQLSNNSLCDKCLRDCKQPEGTILVDCPRFLKRPFKVTTYRYDQLELFSQKK